MNFRQIEAFRAVMSANSVTRAAQLLHSSQSAVSQLIAALEHSLQFKLFERQRGRLWPTPEARILYAEVERSYVGLEKLERTAASLRRFDSGHLHVGCMPLLGWVLLPGVIAQFRRAFPGIRISLQMLPSEMVRDMVVTGRLDVGFVSNDIDRREVNATRLARGAGWCVMAPSHPLARRKTIRVADLAGQPFIALNATHPTRLALDDLARQAKVELDVVIETPYAATVCMLAQQGAGIGLVNPLALADTDPARLIRRRFEPAVEFETLQILPPAVAMSRITQHFLRHVRIGLEAFERNLRLE